MPIELKMPALSPTMEEGTLAKWLVKEGDTVSAGDLLAEIETDKATMEFEAVGDGTLRKILVPQGTRGGNVGTVFALIAGEGEDVSGLSAEGAKPPEAEAAQPKPDTEPASRPAAEAKGPRHEPEVRASTPAMGGSQGEASPSARIKASPLARRLAEQKG